MTILQPGKLPEVKPRIFRGTCNHCGCQVECNDKEASSLGPRCHGGKETKWHIRCPTIGCGNEIDLKEVVLREDGPLKKQAPIGGKVGELEKSLNHVLDTWDNVLKGNPKDVHTEHCCVIHGCKYGREKECTVMTKRAPQSYVCESCNDDGIDNLTDLKRVLEGVTQLCPHCQHTLP